MAAGLSPETFWKITPRELKAHLDGASKRMTREHDARAWLAWHTAALPLAKKFPPLKDLQIGKPAASRRQTWQEQFAAWQGYARAKQKG